MQQPCRYKVLLYIGMGAYITRLLEAQLARALKGFPAVVLSGPRQSGKTTMLKHALAASHRYVLLDEMDKRRFAQADPIGFLDRYPSPVILDEIRRHWSTL